MSSPHSRCARCLALAVILLVAAALGACAPTTTVGSVTLQPVEQSGVWVVRVPATSVGRQVVVRHSPFRWVTIPRGHVPPPGTCRVWHADRAPALQPPPGACPTIELVPAGAYLIYG
jgi:hypothetical protein